MAVLIISTCGVRVKTACHSCSWPRTTSPPVGKKLFWRSWKRSFDLLGLSWVFLTLTMTRLRNTMQTWRSLRPTTSRWVSANNNAFQKGPRESGNVHCPAPIPCYTHAHRHILSYTHTHTHTYTHTHTHTLMLSHRTAI
ncbi:hypothetical protein GJAV_G00098370 [Gymnothorax javanicus]|nr:hypothetical protein GJAV_G00098370 [Gymnothorax javanicus]